MHLAPSLLVRFALPLALMLSLAPTSRAATADSAKAKLSAPACGISYLPLVPGNRWTYATVEAPEADTDTPKGPDLLLPVDKVVITVVSVTPTSAGKTEITLEERADAVTRTTTMECTKDQLEVSPQSFFFAGEPGGALLMELSNLKREGTSLPGSGGFRAGPEQSLIVTADVSRAASDGVPAKFGNGKIEIERVLTVWGKDSVGTASGVYAKTVRVGVKISGRAMVEPKVDKAVEISSGTEAMLWFAPGVGLVQAANTAGHMYQLVEKVLK